MNNLSSSSHFRKSFIANFFEGIDQTTTASLCNISVSTVNEAFNKISEAEEELFLRFGKEKRRRQKSVKMQEEQQSIREILEIYCPVVSGKTFRKQGITCFELYEEYLKLVKMSPELTIRCLQYVM